MKEETKLTSLEPGMPILVGGDRINHVSEELAEKFKPGDRLIVVRKTGDILHLPSAVHAMVTDAVGRALKAFQEQQNASDDQITRFYTEFADRLADDAIWAKVFAANEADVL